jgi:hypothetical protein
MAGVNPISSHSIEHHKTTEYAILKFHDVGQEIDV